MTYGTGPQQRLIQPKIAPWLRNLLWTVRRDSVGRALFCSSPGTSVHDRLTAACFFLITYCGHSWGFTLGFLPHRSLPNWDSICQHRHIFPFPLGMLNLFNLPLLYCTFSTSTSGPLPISSAEKNSLGGSPLITYLFISPTNLLRACCVQSIVIDSLHTSVHQWTNQDCWWRLPSSKEDRQ